MNLYGEILAGTAHDLVMAGVSPPQAVAHVLEGHGLGDISIGGWFNCNLDEKKFTIDNPSARLYGKLYQRWLVAVAGPKPASDEAILFDIQTHLLRPAFGRASLRYSSLKLISASSTPPTAALLSGAKETVNVALSKLNFGSPINDEPNTEGYYATIEFWYDGAQAELRPWPWAARGFLIQCPEDVIVGLVGVLSPREPTAAELEAEKDLLEKVTEPAKKAADEIQMALKVVLWGAAAIILFRVFSATGKVERRTVGY